MNLDNYNVGNYNQLVNLENINVNTQEFYKIIEIIKGSLRNLGINPEEMKIYYQRNSDATSILAIQVTRGSDTDKGNYMFNGCQSWKQGSDVTCDVYMHSDAKSAQKSSRLANLITKDIVSFFKNVEKEFLKNNNFDISLSLMMSLDTKEKNEEIGIKKIIKKFLKLH